MRVIYLKYLHFHVIKITVAYNSNLHNTDNNNKKTIIIMITKVSIKQILFVVQNNIHVIIV